LSIIPGTWETKEDGLLSAGGFGKVRPSSRNETQKRTYINWYRTWVTSVRS
jgi:hypothetical protein